ncbi:hypothetical protein [Granulosicoccus antarcticus]|uniref:hypothetical protein n=1 Tax=Granulosicoccus antarcticus TaxID=437505 RepID=UPI00146FA1EF|nr:hypothetical protein [Granulosicoccus antarcticus]
MILFITFSAQAADESQDAIIKIFQPGQNITAWSGWNVKGSIYIKLDGGSGEDCVKIWGFAWE